MNYPCHYTLTTAATNKSYHSKHSISPAKMKKKTVVSKNRNCIFRSVPLTYGETQNTNLPSIIEVRRLDTKIASSSNILNFLYTCIIATIRLMNDHLLRNARSSKRSGSANDNALTAFSNELTSVEDQNKNESKLWSSDDDDDDDDPDKRTFRQEIKTWKTIIHRKSNNTKDGCRDSHSQNTFSYNCNVIHRTTTHRHNQQNHYMADKILKRHFVHANYLQQKQQSFSL
jgi:hypothetical protein